MRVRPGRLCVVGITLLAAGLGAAPAVGHGPVAGLLAGPAAASLRVVDQIGGSPGSMVAANGLVFAGQGSRLVAYRPAAPGAEMTVLGRSEVMPGYVLPLTMLDSQYLVANVADVGLWLFDVGQPDSPRVVSTLDSEGAALNAAVHQGFLYVADLTAGVRVVDARAPERLTSALIRLPDRGLDGNTMQAYATAVANGHLFVFYADGYAFYGLVAVYDLADPGAPRFVTVVTPEWKLLYPHSVAVMGDSLFAGSNSGLYALDASDPAALRVVGALKPGDVDFRMARFAPLDGPYLALGTEACSGDAPAGVAVVDVSAAEAMRVVGFVETGGATDAIAAEGWRVFLADWPCQDRDGLRVIDAADVTRPVDLGRTTLLSLVQRVALSPERRFLGGRGVWSLPLGDDGAWFHQGTVRASVLALQAAAGHVYAATGFGGLQVVAVTETGDLAPRPTLPADVDAGLEDVDVVVAGPRLLRLVHTRNPRDVTEASSRLDVLDLADPASPRLLGSLTLAADTTRLAAWRDWAALAGGSTLHLVDLADPAAPRTVGDWNLPGEIAGLGFDEDGHLFLAARNQLRAYDLRDPRVLRLLGQATLPMPIAAFDAAGGIAVVVVHASVADATGHTSYAHVLDVRYLSAMVRLANTALPGDRDHAAEQVRLDGDLAHIAAGAYGLLTLRVDGRPPPKLYLPTTRRGAE